MSENKPTRGPWFTDEAQPDDLFRYVMHGEGDSFGYVCRISTNGNANPESDARLIAEVGTVHHETGLTPRQLVERVKELEEACRHCEDLFMRYEINRANGEGIADGALVILRAALSKSLPNTVAEVK